MQIKTFEFNPLGVNTYVLSDETGECVVIDPASFYPDEREQLVNYLLDNELRIKYILNTHLHFDHIFGINLLVERFGTKVLCHSDDLFLLNNIDKQMEAFGLSGDRSDFKPDIDEYLTDNQIILFGNQSIRVFYTPGHSPGSVSFFHESQGCVFCGDLLFYAGVGRTDLPGGSYEQLSDSIQSRIFTLPDSTVVYPGHGPSTTVGFEKRNNPFIGA